ncbi:MAG: hypothetical protein LAQ30_03670 [Acidobacteriia bacterium]|nr:hypothetical protein [Terriglobia bacterium]
MTPRKSAPIIDDTSKIPPEAGRNVAIGTETGKLTFDDGSKLEMPGHFTAVRLWAPNGVARLNESGTIEKGTGTFTNASGNFTTHGVFGPGVLPADSAAVMGVVQDTSGTICLNLADIVVGGKK